MYYVMCDKTDLKFFSSMRPLVRYPIEANRIV